MNPLIGQIDNLVISHLFIALTLKVVLSQPLMLVVALVAVVGAAAAAGCSGVSL